MLQFFREWFCTLPIPAVSAGAGTIIVLNERTGSLFWLVASFGALRFILNGMGFSYDILKGSTDLLTCTFHVLTKLNVLKAGLSWLTLVVIWGFFSVCVDSLSLLSTVLQFGTVSSTLGSSYGAFYAFNGLSNLVGGIIAQSMLCFRSYAVLKQALPNWLHVASGLDADQQHYVQLL